MFIALPEALRSQLAWSCRNESKSLKTASIQRGEVGIFRSIRVTGVRLSSIRKSRFANSRFPSPLCFFEPRGIQLFRLPSQVREGAVVDDDVGRAPGGGVGRDLRGDAATRVRRVASFGFPAPDAFGLRRDDEQHAVGLRLGPPF